MFVFNFQGGGIEISFSGFNDKMTELAHKVACTMRGLAQGGSVDKGLFNVVLETLRSRYKNATMQPEKQCYSARLALLLPHRAHPRDATRMLDMVSVEGFRLYLSTMYQVAL